MTRPLLLDLFCCAGGAAVGYERAGFDVIGVDIKARPRFPFTFVQGDALETLEFFMEWQELGRPIAAIHASPPCQSFSQAVKKANRKNHVNLIPETRAALKATGLPYVIENVERAPLENAVRLCGSSFGLPIRRHRKFEMNFDVMVPPCAHSAYPAIYPPAWNRTNPLRVLSISGGYQKVPAMGEGFEEFMVVHKRAMGVDWDISYNELSEAIPPAYTEFLGAALMDVVASRGGVTA